MERHSNIDLGTYHSRDRQPITLEQFAELFSDEKYRRVRSTVIGDTHISTVWLGINHQFFTSGPPLIFETMVFGATDPHWNDYQERWSTEAQAIEGHEKVVAELRQEKKDASVHGAVHE